MWAPAPFQSPFDRLGVEGGANVELLTYAVEQPPGDPKVVGNRRCADRADLEFPLAGHDLSVDPGDGQSGMQAGV